MSDHLPECERSKPCDKAEYHDHTWRGDCVITCICDRLRACEERVENRIIHGGLSSARFQAGFAAGVDFAFDAVFEDLEALVIDDPDECRVCQGKQQALDAVEDLMLDIDGQLIPFASMYDAPAPRRRGDMWIGWAIGAGTMLIPLILAIAAR